MDYKLKDDNYHADISTVDESRVIRCYKVRRVYDDSGALIVEYGDGEVFIYAPGKWGIVNVTSNVTPPPPDSA